MATGYNWPQGRNVTQYQLIDDLSKTQGAHNLKFGVNFHRIDLTYLSYQVFQNGRITERSLGDFFSGGSTGNLLQQRFPQASEAPFAYYNLGLYAMDEWKVTPRLNLTLTIRADHNSNPVCQTNCFANLVEPFTDLMHNPNVPYNQVIHTNLHQALAGTTKIVWQPRFGFAWTPTKKADLVVRGGFGLFGDTFPGQVAGLMALNTPNLNSFTINNGPITPGAPGNLFSTASARQPIAAQRFLQRTNGGANHGFQPLLPASEFHHHELALQTGAVRRVESGSAEGTAVESGSERQFCGQPRVQRSDHEYRSQRLCARFRRLASDGARRAVPDGDAVDRPEPSPTIRGWC